MTKRIIAWFFWLCGTGLLYLFENNTETRILLLSSLLLPLVFIAAAMFAGKKVTVQLNAPKQANKGEIFSVNLCLSHAGLLASVEGVLLCRNLLTEETIRFPFRVNGKEQSFPMQSAHCGNVEITAEVRICDVLGLYRKMLPTKETTAVFIRPELFMPQIALIEDTSASEGEAYSLTKPGTDPSETFAIREYLPGDSIRQIHWKLSQKTDTVMIRELGLPISGQVLLLFDGAYGIGQDVPTPSIYDAMTEIFLSMARAMLLDGIRCTVAWQPRDAEFPEYRRLETEQDFVQLEVDFFASAIQRENGITAYSTEETFSHTAIIAPSCPKHTQFGGLGTRVTMLTNDATTYMGSEFYNTVFSVEKFKEELYRIEL